MKFVVQAGIEAADVAHDEAGQQPAGSGWQVGTGALEAAAKRPGRPLDQ